MPTKLGAPNRRAPSWWVLPEHEVISSLGARRDVLVRLADEMTGELIAKNDDVGSGEGTIWSKRCVDDLGSFRIALGRWKWEDASKPRFLSLEEASFGPDLLAYYRAGQYLFTVFTHRVIERMRGVAGVNELHTGTYGIFEQKARWALVDRECRTMIDDARRRAEAAADALLTQFFDGSGVDFAALNPPNGFEQVPTHVHRSLVWTVDTRVGIRYVVSADGSAMDALSRQQLPMARTFDDGVIRAAATIRILPERTEYSEMYLREVTTPERAELTIDSF